MEEQRFRASIDTLEYTSHSMDYISITGKENTLKKMSRPYHSAIALKV